MVPHFVSSRLIESVAGSAGERAGRWDKSGRFFGPQRLRSAVLGLSRAPWARQPVEKLTAVLLANAGKVDLRAI